jgi:peptidoglycan/xylan/chitin deacetylase (PgdA/CDA1 family)
MSLGSIFGTVRKHIVCSLHRRIVPLGDGGPYVSVTFDDFPRSAYTVGGSILKEYGVRGTYYVAMGLMNTSNALGELFRIEDLRSAANEGHELASHTFSHQSSRAVPCAEFRHDVRKGWRAIHEIVGGQAPTRNFAFPYGAVSISAKLALENEMMSCRGIYGGVNGPYIDLNLLLANSLYGDPNDLGEVAQLIMENQKRKGWLIFYTHDVSPAPSRYGCSPRFLESTVRMAVQNGANVLPVAEVLARIL